METSGKVSVLRCRKCRKCVVDASCLLTVSAVGDVAAECRIWHLDFDRLPTWVLASIHQAHWTSGRLCCQHCGARLGGFSFTSRPVCPCGLDPSVYLSKSRLDPDCRGPPVLGGATGGGPRLSPAQRLSVKPSPSMATPPCPTTPPPCTAGGEFGLIAAAPEADPRLSSPGLVLSPPQPESPSCPGKVVPRTTRTVDYGAGTGQSQSFSLPQQMHPQGEAAQTAPAPLWPRPSAAGQSEQAERPGTTPTQEVRSVRRRRPSVSSADEGAGSEEEAGQPVPSGSLLLDRPAVAPPRPSRRERNRLKSQRRKERRREQWIQSRLQEETRGLQGDGSSSEDGGMDTAERRSLTCAVCLDVFFRPHACQPCGHVFCEPCLRTLARNRPSCTPCPLCRTPVTHALFQRELSERTQALFPKLSLSRSQSFLKSGCSRSPLPGSRKLFHIFSGLRVHSNTGGRRLFPHGGYGLGDVGGAYSRGWRSDTDLLLYVCSINGVIGLAVGLLLCCLLFSY